MTTFHLVWSPTKKERISQQQQQKTVFQKGFSFNKNFTIYFDIIFQYISFYVYLCQIDFRYSLDLVAWSLNYMNSMHQQCCWILVENNFQKMMIRKYHSSQKATFLNLNLHYLYIHKKQINETTTNILYIYFDDWLKNKFNENKIKMYCRMKYLIIWENFVLFDLNTNFVLTQTFRQRLFPFATSNSDRQS